MAAAPVESCQSVALRSPWGRLWSVLYTNKRLHRTRRRFQHISANSLISAAHKAMNSLRLRARVAALENADKARSAGLARVLQDSHRVRVSLAAAEADAAANDARALDALRRLESARVEALRFRGELHVAVGTGKTLENYRYENDRLRQALLEAQQNEKGAEREQRRLVTENNRFRECLKHSEREKRDLVAQIRAMASFLASSRQQELQKAEPVGLKRMPHGSATRKPLRPKN